MDERTIEAFQRIVDWLAEGKDERPRSFSLTQDNSDGEFQGRIGDRKLAVETEPQVSRALFLGVYGPTGAVVVEARAEITAVFPKGEASADGQED
jgi:hypothetical protein